ncbi:glycosyl transferase [Alisedimentitalea sp. MJ-SS2]|uniref:glycosyl transferase n=1 Tax=Aliisedimentitalea sp. MJ-SS2 TaxID=3049795 RepID=UPI002908DA40|nr:glycosyl transferase [Alisedimentitalea sp. MJ-SS2]MDU8930012.1 glycosyl transferase [Alisedimentitalea sp. MJ-SS2]
MTGTAAGPDGLHLLQSLILPEPALTPDQDPYLRLKGAAELDLDHGQITFAPGGEALFDVYFNIFSLGKWRKHCALRDLHLQLEGQGRFELVIGRAREDHDAPDQPLIRTITLDKAAPCLVDLSTVVAETEGPAVLWFALRALGDGYLAGAAWQTAQAPRRAPILALAITTFRREASVARSVARFENFLQSRPDMAPHLHLLVVDNGQSAGLTATDHVTPFDNANLGGAGGFARGLIEARHRGASHCLFMDDDASVHMESVERTWRFLAHAVDDSTAVAGAMSIAAHKWAIWENGALFNRHCIQLEIGTDLRDPAEVAELDFNSTADVAHNFYGGWWYFAFPLAHVRHMPFPFFVRGDDISFGLVHDFNTVTLPGVMSFQDEDFANKESLQTLYLDLRSHLAHHLAIPAMEIGRLGSIRIAWWFFLRSLVQCHYESLDALNLSFADALEGPDFFAANADMSARRAKLTSMRRDEAWKDDDSPLPETRIRFDPERRLPRLLMKFTVNGHLLPFFHLYGNRITLDAGLRGQIRRTWGATRITYVNETGQRFTVTHSKRHALSAAWTAIRLSWRLWRHYPDIRDNWRQGYDRLTTQAWWEKTLGL